MRILLSLLLVWMLVACDEETDSSASGDEDTDNATNYSLKLSGISEQEDRGNKLNIKVEILKNDQLVEDGKIAESEITLAIKCGEHEIGEKQKKNATEGKVAFDEIEISGEKFNGKCSATVSATIDGENISDNSEFTVSELPQSPELTIADGGITVGQLISIDVESGFSGKVKVQPQEFEKCRGYFLIYNDGNRLTEVLTNGVVIPAKNGKLEGLVLIKKNNDSPTCNGFVLVVGKNSYPQKTISGDNPNFDGNLQASNGKLSLAYSGTPPMVIFFNTAEEGNLWTKYNGEMSSPAVSDINYSRSSNAALVKTDRGWSYVRSR